MQKIRDRSLYEILRIENIRVNEHKYVFVINNKARKL